MERINIFDNVCILSLTVRKIGDTGQGNLDEVNTEADKKLLRIKTQLLAFEEYDALKSACANVRNAVKALCYGGRTMTVKALDGRKYAVGAGINRFIKPGCYMVTYPMVEKVQEALDRGQEEVQAAVNRLCEVYEDRVAEMVLKLKGQAVESDFPSIAKIRKECGVEYSFMCIGTPPTEEQVGKAIAERETNKLQQQARDLSEEMRLFPRVMMKELVDHMIERLTPGEDGKKKRFNETAVTKMKSFLEDFEARNVTNDQELAGLVERAREILAGKDADDYRKDDNFRTAVLESLAPVKSTLDEMMAEVPERAILVEE